MQCAKIVLLHVESLIHNLVLINIKCVGSFDVVVIDLTEVHILENITAWQQWYFVSKIVLTYHEKNCSSDRENKAENLQNF